MGTWVQRKPDGAIWSRSPVQQFEKAVEGQPLVPLSDQEYLEDDHPDLVALGMVDAKREKIQAAGQAYLRATQRGVLHGGKYYQLDDMSATRIIALGATAGFVVQKVEGFTWEEDFVFIASDNSEVPFTAAQFVRLANAAKNRMVRIRITYRNMKNAILRAATPEALDRIDVNAGWED